MLRCWLSRDKFGQMRVKHLVGGSEPACGSRCAAREHAPRPALGDGGRWDPRADLGEPVRSPRARAPLGPTCRSRRGGIRLPEGRVRCSSASLKFGRFRHLKPDCLLNWFRLIEPRFREQAFSDYTRSVEAPGAASAACCGRDADTETGFRGVVKGTAAACEPSRPRPAPPSHGEATQRLQSTVAWKTKAPRERGSTSSYLCTLLLKPISRKRDEM